jgi:hypothetical protein
VEPEIALVLVGPVAAVAADGEERQDPSVEVHGFRILREDDREREQPGGHLLPNVRGIPSGEGFIPARR